MKRNILTKILAVAAVLALFAGFYALAATSGSAEDPLVSLSYIEEVVTPELEDYIDSAVREKGEEIEYRIEDKLYDFMDELYYN